jgi:hypothetical protein
MLADTPLPRGFGAALASVDTFFQALQNGSLHPGSALQATCGGTRGLIEFLLSRQSFSAAFQVALRFRDYRVSEIHRGRMQNEQQKETQRRIFGPGDLWF